MVLMVLANSASCCNSMVLAAALECCSGACCCKASMPCSGKFSGMSLSAEKDGLDIIQREWSLPKFEQRAETVLCKLFLYVRYYLIRGCILFCRMAPEVMEPSHGYNLKTDIRYFGITALSLPTAMVLSQSILQ
ncbi:hypothetical protein U1Q18_008775 [Sarracenia purpurea var. burkii]